MLPHDTRFTVNIKYIIKCVYVVVALCLHYLWGWQHHLNYPGVVLLLFSLFEEISPWERLTMLLSSIGRTDDFVFPALSFSTHTHLPVDQKSVLYWEVSMSGNVDCLFYSPCNILFSHIRFSPDRNCVLCTRRLVIYIIYTWLVRTCKSFPIFNISKSKS